MMIALAVLTFLNANYHVLVVSAAKDSNFTELYAQFPLSKG